MVSPVKKLAFQILLLLTVSLLSIFVRIGMAEMPVCQDREDTERTPLGWWDKIRGAVFKVYIARGDDREARGTATLIDKRGYLLTASHIFEYKKDNTKLLDPTKEDLEIVNYNGTIKLKAKEIFHRATITDPDISLLKVDMDQEVSDQVTAIDTVFDMPRRPSRYILMGYKVKDVVPDLAEFLSSQPISEMPRYIRSRGDTPYYGESGSLGLIQTGQGVAILEGYEIVNGKQDPNNFKLVPLAQGTTVLSRIEASGLVKRMLEKLREGNVSYVLNTIDNSGITAMELYLFVTEIKKNIDSYRKVLDNADELRRTLRYKLMCSNLYDTDADLDRALRIQTALTNIEGGQVATEVYKALLAKGIHASARRAAFEAARDFFQRAEAMGSFGDAPGYVLLTSSKEDYGRYQAEYAYILNEGLQNYPDSGIAKDAVGKTIIRALTWDNTNELAYKLAATEDKDRGLINGRLDKAIAELPADDPKRPRLEQMRTTAYGNSVWKDPSISGSIQRELSYGTYVTP